MRPPSLLAWQIIDCDRIVGGFKMPADDADNKLSGDL
jgi:hypothetical protein